MEVTARQSCFSVQATFCESSTLGPCAHISHCSGGLARKSPFAVVGRSAYEVAWAGPPTTSQRYHRAPLAQALFEGRNQAQLSCTRIARRSSTPMNLSKAFSDVGEIHR